MSCDCQVMQRSRELSFHQEVQFRNILVEYLTGWVQGEIMFTRDHCTHEENLHRLVIVYSTPVRYKVTLISRDDCGGQRER